MRIVKKTDVGNVREINQDYVQCFQKNENEMLAVLCDGMGGHNAGEVASLLAAQDIIEQYQNTQISDDEDDIKIWLYEAIMHAHQTLREKGLQDSKYKDMGTTVVVALIKNYHLYLSHVGDSRAYFLQDQMNQLTRDDTLVNILVDSGTISEDEAFFHPQKNILLQAVGVSEKLNVSFTSQPFTQGMLILCSDGLYNSLFEQQIHDILKSSLSLEEKGNQLMKDAKKFGGKDNIGFILIDGEEDRV